ncbi:motile sperm domain-containing protein 1-like [Protopterus annectens]|uniref:motile sperm domain-containing protein 1-like n=1 Tax=Protopterus annectens TaxID=7888 RepID=UPI001CF941F5|nr:motile sperm domain-containing protein 1-like [Protopterus annectens]
MRRRAQQEQGKDQSERQQESKGSRSDHIIPLGQKPSISGGRVPVFVFPAELAFYASDQTSHKQVLTIYNPYRAVLKFKVLSTAPNKYTVIDAEGYVKKQSCIDIVIRHRDISACHYGAPDKFRIEVFEEGNQKPLGWKTVSSVLLPARKGESPADRKRTRVTTGERSTWNSASIVPVRRGYATPPLVLILLVALICITVLMLPLQGDSSTLVPKYLHVTVIQKLVAAYVLVSSDKSLKPLEKASRALKRTGEKVYCFYFSLYGPSVTMSTSADKPGQ